MNLYRQRGAGYPEGLELRRMGACDILRAELRKCIGCRLPVRCTATNYNKTPIAGFFCFRKVDVVMAMP